MANKKNQKVTVAEKLGRGPAKAAAKLKDARKNLLAKSAETKGAKALNVSGVTALWVLEYLTKILNGVVVDNRLIEWIERAYGNVIKPGKNKKGADKKFAAFFKKNPWILSYLTYYIMLYGGVKIAEDKLPDIFESLQEWVSGDKSSDEVVQEYQVMFNPRADYFYQQCDSVENINLVGIVYTEHHRTVAKVQAKENVWTDGFGMTWSMDANGNMTIRNYADTKNNRKKGYKPHKPRPGKNLDENVEETQSFIRGHVDPKIKKNMTREFSVNEYYALCIAGYQLEGHLPLICKQLSAATTPQEIADAFITPTMYKYGGTPKRRWICAMLAAGYITIEDMLNADIDAFYSPDINTFIRNGHFVCNEATVQYVMGLKRNGSTREMVKKLSDGKLALKQLGGEPQQKTKIVDFTQSSASDVKITKSMNLIMEAEKEYANKKYEKAAQLFQKSIDIDPDNMEAYSSLALAYNKLGAKYNSIDYYQKSVDAVTACNKRMNANRALLMDHAVKGSSYYNAGLSREAMGDIYKKQGNTADANKNYKLAKKNYENALYNYDQLDGFETNKEIYKKSIERIDNVLKAKKLSFNSAGTKLKLKVPSKKDNTLAILEMVKEFEGKA